MHTGCNCEKSLILPLCAYVLPCTAPFFFFLLPFLMSVCCMCGLCCELSFFNYFFPPLLSFRPVCAIICMRVRVYRSFHQFLARFLDELAHTVF